MKNKVKRPCSQRTRSFFAGTRHGRYALHVESNAVSWHGQRFAGTRHGRYAQNDVCSRHEQHGNRLGRVCHAELVSASHIEKTLKQVQGDDKGVSRVTTRGVFRVTIRVRSGHV